MENPVVQELLYCGGLQKEREGRKSNFHCKGMLIYSWILLGQYVNILSIVYHFTPICWYNEHRKIDGKFLKLDWILNADKELNNDQHLEVKHMPPKNTEKKIYTSIKDGQHQLDLKDKLLEENLLSQNYVFIKGKQYEFI